MVHSQPVELDLLHDDAMPSIPSDVLASIAGSTERAILFSRDPYFREGYESLVMCANAIDPTSYLYDVGYVLLRPESVQHPECGRILHALQEANLTITSMHKVKIGTSQAIDLWQYTAHIYNLRSIRAQLRALARGPSLILTLRSTTSEPSLETLARIKGSALRQDCGLRSLLGPPNTVNRWIHSPDDRLDLIRELSVLSEFQSSGLFEALLHGTALNDVQCEATFEKLRCGANANMAEGSVDTGNEWHSMALHSKDARAGFRETFRRIELSSYPLHFAKGVSS